LLQRLANTVYEQREVELCIEPAVVTLLLDQGGFDAALGARPMKRAIARLVEAPLAQQLLRSAFGAGDKVLVHVDERGSVCFERQDVAAAE
jgi:ATP-dependent Clp protease ATP-binding subunit ClpC